MTFTAPVEKLDPEEILLPAVAAGEPGSDLRIGHNIRRTILPGGTRIITEKMSGTLAASIGMWVPRGSRDEAPTGLGATHFLEHLLFKGTDRRNAKEIASAFDRVGGEANAATSKEHTHYYADILGEDLPLAIDVLMDMMMSPSLNPEAFELERGIILDELAMSHDDGNEQAHDALSAHLFPGHPLGRPIGGTLESVRATRLDAVKSHYRAGYTPDQLVVACAGAVEHEQVCDLVAAALREPGRAQWQDLYPDAPARDFSLQISKRMEKWPRDVETGVFDVRGNFEQTHLLLGGPGLAVGDPRETTMNVLKTALGGGMSSRLFQSIRETRGLAYTTYVFNVSYRDCGQFGLGAACNPANMQEVCDLMQSELEKIATQPMGEEELNRVKSQLRGATLLAMEDNSVRMNRLALAEVMRGCFTPIAVKLSRLEKVQPGNILDLAACLAQNQQIQIHLGS